MQIDNFTSQSPDEPIPWDKIEPAILPTVRALNERGFRTNGSCEGHAGEFPWVTLDWCDHMKLAEALHEMGAHGFTINQRWEFLSRQHALRFVQVEFWGRDCLPQLQEVT